MPAMTGVRLTASESEAVHERLARGEAALAVQHRQHREARAGVVVAVEPGDRQEVGHLPEEEDGEQDGPRPGRASRWAALQPITGGSAPGTAPTRVASGVRFLSGV